MKFISKVVTGLIAGLLIATGMALPAFATTTYGSNASGVDTILANINTYRSQNGLTTLSTSQPVTDVAANWANIEIQNGVMSHNPNLMAELNPATQAGEVLSLYYTADAVTNAWINSAAHRAILLNSSWTTLGIAYIPINGYYYAVVDFATYATAGGQNTANAPTGITANVADTTITFGWNSATGSTNPVTTYDYTIYDAATSQVVYNGYTTGARSVTYAGERGHAYYLQVRGHSSDGAGQYGQSSSAAIAAVAPSAPDHISLIRYNSATQLSAAWWTPANGGTALTSITTRLYQDGNLYQTTTYAPGQTSVIWSNIPTGHTYTFTVTASNTIGTSPASAQSPAVTLVPENNGTYTGDTIGTTWGSGTSGTTSGSNSGANATTVTNDWPPQVAPIPMPPPSAPTITPPSVVVPTPAPVTITPPPVTTNLQPAPPVLARPIIATTSLKLKWSNVQHGGVDIARYVIKIAAKNKIRTLTCNDRTLGKTITGLTRHTRYSLTVTAFDTDGDQTASKTITVQTR